MKALGKASVVAAVAGAGLALSAVPASAAYTFFDDDYIKGGTTAAVFDGSWGPNGDALVRWTKDSSTTYGRSGKGRARSSYTRPSKATAKG